jgi:hypothetical protein
MWTIGLRTYCRAAAGKDSLTAAHVNRTASTVFHHDVHAAFLRWVQSVLEINQRSALLFCRAAGKRSVEHRHASRSPGHLRRFGPRWDQLFVGGFPSWTPWLGHQQRLSDHA